MYQFNNNKKITDKCKDSHTFWQKNIDNFTMIFPVMYRNINFQSWNTDKQNYIKTSFGFFLMTHKNHLIVHLIIV